MIGERPHSGGALFGGTYRHLYMTLIGVRDEPDGGIVVGKLDLVLAGGFDPLASYIETVRSGGQGINNGRCAGHTTSLCGARTDGTPQFDRFSAKIRTFRW